MIYHCDKASDIEKYEITAQGFLRITGTVAHVGYLDYPQKDGTIEREYVPIETLFDQKHIDSTETASVTLFHPPGASNVTPQTFSSYSQGMVKRVIKDEGKEALLTDMIICGEKAIQAIKNGITALSMGYTATRKQVGENEFIQTERICNHISIVQKGRADKAKLHLDSYDHQYDNEIRQFYQIIYPLEVKPYQIKLIK